MRVCVSREPWRSNNDRPGELHREAVHVPSPGIFTEQDVAARVEETVCRLDAAEAVGWTEAYLERFDDAAPLVQALALAATRLGNDPHNQEIAQCYLEDFGKTRSTRRGRLLLACAQQTAAHRKYGDPLEASRRFGEAMGIARLQ